MFSDILRRQVAGESHLPRYNYHVRDTVVSLDDGRVMFTVRCKGLPFEVISDGVLENNFDSLNNVFLSIAKSTGARLAVWAHLDHFETRFGTDYKFSYKWLRDMSARYMEQFEHRGDPRERLLSDFSPEAARQRQPGGVHQGAGGGPAGGPAVASQVRD